MSKSIFALLIVLTGVTAAAGQSPLSIQGVWRNVGRVIPASTNPGDRIDPFGHVPAGTQADVQPGLLIITLTPIENSQGRIAAGVTSRYVRVE